jgi:very-short-patch-repair endonuclease
MGYQTVQELSRAVWRLARRQHWVVSRAQLIALGMHPQAIKHRIANGRLHPIRRGVYAVGRRSVTRYGHRMAAVLACGHGAVLSHLSAAANWQIREVDPVVIDISVAASRRPREQGIRVHRRAKLGEEDVTRHHGIPVTTPLRTLIDLATQLSPPQIERAINGADKFDLIDPEALRAALDERRGRRGVRALRQILDRATFVLTETELEARFVPIARRAGLPRPLIQEGVNGFRVDFYWPELGLIVETDGLRYHRTPAQQAKDRVRDQVHAAAGLTTLRFTHAQVVYETAHVEQTLATVATRLRAQVALLD